MSYIAFDLDALNVARDVGAACGLPEERITHGLLRMWAWCFREKADTVDEVQVQGFFSAAAAPALVSFGFLAAAGDRYRVRGADRYLRVSEQRSKAGKARAASAGRSAGRFAGAAPAAHQRDTSTHQRSTSEKPALTPNTEHRTPNETTAPALPSRPRDSDLLCEDFVALVGAPYVWQGSKDGVALAALLKENSIDEVRKRWRAGLQGEGWLLVRTVAQLRQKWNDLATAKAVKVSIEHQPSRML